MDVIDPVPVIARASPSIVVGVASALLTAVEFGVVVVSDVGIVSLRGPSHTEVIRAMAINEQRIRTNRAVFTSVSHQVAGCRPNYRVGPCSRRGRGNPGSDPSVSFRFEVSN